MPVVQTTNGNTSHSGQFVQRCGHSWFVDGAHSGFDLPFTPRLTLNALINAYWDVDACRLRAARLSRPSPDCLSTLHRTTSHPTTPLQTDTGPRHTCCCAAPLLHPTQNRPKRPPGTQFWLPCRFALAGSVVCANYTVVPTMGRYRFIQADFSAVSACQAHHLPRTAVITSRHFSFRCYCRLFDYCSTLPVWLVPGSRLDHGSDTNTHPPRTITTALYQRVPAKWHARHTTPPTRRICSTYYTYCGQLRGLLVCRDV